MGISRLVIPRLKKNARFWRGGAGLAIDNTNFTKYNLKIWTPSIHIML